MPQVGVSLTKTFPFRGVAQEFGNTYHYTTPGVVGTGNAGALLDEVLNREKLMFSNTVQYVRGRVWTSGGTKAENEMLVDRALTEIGTAGAGSGKMDRERAFLVRFRAGNDSRGNPVYLRKWWHLDVNVLATQTISDAQLQNTAQLSSSQRDQIVSYGNTFKSITVLAVTFTLCAESGREIDGSTVAHPYLEHRQLGDQWRG